MSGFSIGISGLSVAQGAIDLIGTNMANATTDGYHRQDPVISSLDFSTGKTVSGGGAQITDVRNSVDTLLELEMMRQQTTQAQTNEELESLRTVEAAFGDMQTNKLDAAIGTFFESLQQLAAQPDSQPLQQQAVWNADAMTQQFHTMSTFLSDLASSTKAKLPDLVAHVNDLATRVASLNQQLNSMGIKGASANLLRDQRDQAVQDLSKLCDIQTVARPGEEAVDVIAWGVPLVSGSVAWQLSTGVDRATGELNVQVQSSASIIRNPAGGQIGGLIAVHNKDLVNMQSQLDAACHAIVTGVNEQHAQGSSADGPFRDLLGVAHLPGTLDSWTSDVTAGALYVRVVDKSTGQFTCSAIAIDPATDTMASVAAKLDALDHVQASVSGGALHIQADTGYGFDFMPTLAGEPCQDNLTGTAKATVGGQYTGATNELFTCAVKGSGDTSVTDGLSLEVRNHSGDIVKTFNVGQGYASGDPLDLGNGVTLSLSSGTLKAGDTFTVQALATSDETGILAAAGLNAFFVKDASALVAVRPDLLSNPRQLAVNLQSDTDGGNASALAAVGDQAMDSLGGLSSREYVRQFITGIGQRISGLQSTQDNTQAVLNTLVSQQETISGVDVNEEAAKLMAFQRMYQAMAKLIGSQDNMLQVLVETIR